MAKKKAKKRVCYTVKKGPKKGKRICRKVSRKK